jgi:hypothetical protein
LQHAIRNLRGKALSKIAVPMGFDKVLQLGNHIADVSAALTVCHALNPIPFAPDRDARDDLGTMEDVSLSLLSLQEYFCRIGRPRDNIIAEQDQDHGREKLGDEFLSFGEFHIVGIREKTVCGIKRGIRNNGGYANED